MIAALPATRTPFVNGARRFDLPREMLQNRTMANDPIVESRARATFVLDEAKLDAALIRWAGRRHAAVSSLEDALEHAPGFDLVELMRALFPDWATPELGHLSNALEAAGYWLFVNLGDPLVAHPPSFHLKTVRIVAARRQITADGRRALLAVSRDGDPVLIAVPAVPLALMPGARVSFERSRMALLTFARACVDRVNLIAGSALAFDALIRDGYPSGEIE